MLDEIFCRIIPKGGVYPKGKARNRTDSLACEPSLSARWLAAVFLDKAPLRLSLYDSPRTSTTTFLFYFFFYATSHLIVSPLTFASQTSFLSRTHPLTLSEVQYLFDATFLNL